MVFSCQEALLGWHSGSVHACTVLRHPMIRRSQHGICWPHPHMLHVCCAVTGLLGVQHSQQRHLMHCLVLLCLTCPPIHQASLAGTSTRQPRWTHSSQNPKPRRALMAWRRLSCAPPAAPRPAACSTPPTARASCRPASAATAPRSRRCLHTWQTFSGSSRSSTHTGGCRHCPAALVVT